MITHGSLFSGIGGIDLGFERAGIETIWQCEIDEKASAVLEKRFPGVPNYRDVRKVTNDGTIRKPDIISGGFPCQDVSLAGRRAGLAGERSGLWFEYQRIIDEFQPRWVVAENVPGLLSSNEGNDFRTVIGALEERGYCVSWRVLDAQYFGVAQRRRRVFIVGSLGNIGSAKVLFEREGVQGHTPQSRKTGKGTAGTFTIRSGKEGGGKGYLGREEGAMTLGGQPQWVYAGFSAGNSSEARSIAYSEEKSPPIRAEAGGNSVPAIHGFIPTYSLTLANTNRNGPWHKEELAQTLDTWGAQGVNQIGVRRLTPTECERLQGFPDQWTDEQSDTNRYKQLGNAVCVNVAEWIGKRIMQVEP